MPWVLQGSFDGVAAPALEGARRGRLRVGIVLAMLKVQRAQRKSDGRARAHAMSAAVPAV
jgi:hypothetical protein